MDTNAFRTKELTWVLGQILFMVYFDNFCHSVSYAHFYADDTIIYSKASSIVSAITICLPYSQNGLVPMNCLTVPC